MLIYNCFIRYKNTVAKTVLFISHILSLDNNYDKRKLHFSLLFHILLLIFSTYLIYTYYNNSNMLSHYHIF